MSQNVITFREHHDHSTHSTKLHQFQIRSFYSASALIAMQSAVLARGILSVRLSRSVIVSRRMKIWSCGFQHLVGQSF